MVGIIVIGMVGGIIAATVFAIIPWSQDKAAKQQLDSVVSAQQAFFGLSADPLNPTPINNAYSNLHDLEEAGLIKGKDNYCTVGHGQRFSAYAKSATGKIWIVTADNTQPREFTATLPSYCLYLKGVGNYDSMQTLTQLTYKCDTDTTGRTPMRSELTGTETWSDGKTKTYSNSETSDIRSFEANKEYTVSFVGTYKIMRATLDEESKALNTCLRSVDYWGKNVGVIDATSAFYQAGNLTDVPDSIPNTISTFYHLLGLTKINDPDISNWDMSRAKNTRGMFLGNPNFNQPLNDWDMSNVVYANNMFWHATSFNQPLDKWNVSKVQDMDNMFLDAPAFNQNLSGWDTSSVLTSNNFADPAFPNEFMPAKTKK